MSLNSRRKGKVGEREFAGLLREHGFDARRGVQFAGGADSPAWELTCLEVSSQQRTILHLDRRDAVARQRLACRVTRSAERQHQRQARDDHRRRRPEPLEHTHSIPPRSCGLGDFKPLTLGNASLEPCKGG